MGPDAFVTFVNVKISLVPAADGVHMNTTLSFLTWTVVTMSAELGGVMVGGVDKGIVNIQNVAAGTPWTNDADDKNLPMD